MAFTRKFLTALGIEADKVDEIISAHSEVVEGLKSERDSYKADAEKNSEAKSELDKLKADIEAKKGGDGEFEKKYKDLKAEYDDYKKSISDKEKMESKKSEYRKLLRDLGISEKRFEAILRLADLDGIELNDDGTFKDSEKVKESIKNEWSEYIEKPVVKGANPSTPPTNNGSGSTKTKAEILAIRDTAKRHQAIAENPELFGITLTSNKE